MTKKKTVTKQLKTEKDIKKIIYPKFKETPQERKSLIINTLYSSTGLSYNQLDSLVGDAIEFCIEKGYNDRILLGCVFGHLWGMFCKENVTTD